MATSKLPNFSISDDRGNPLTRNKPNVPTNDSSKKKGKSAPEESTRYEQQAAGYSTGFTIPEDFLSSNNPSELGQSLLTSGVNKEISDTNNRNDRNKNYESSFIQSRGSVDFRHNLDRQIPQPVATQNEGVSYPDLSKIYIGSSYPIATSKDNEDPTMLGYDLLIDFDNSPLFNGSVEDFINTLPNTEEVQSRLQTITEFKLQFYKFFNISSRKTAFSNIGGDADAAEQPKVYYFRKISGLDRLVEGNTSADMKKSFINYGEDFITLQLNEDVEQNMGYLATLYKALSWSRINGKQVIPANLLRFNLILSVTEIRKYNRVIAFDKDDFGIYPDLISRYEYTLYECQMFFPKMPHGDALDLSSPAILDGYELQFNYKFSTMKFIRFQYQDSLVAFTRPIDNLYTDIYKRTPQNSQLLSANGSIDLRLIQEEYKKISTITDQPELVNEPTENSLTQPAEQKSRFRQNMERLGGDLKRAAINEVNRRVVTQARLLNKTLENIRNSIPFAGRMGPPTNVYEGDQLSLRTDVINAVRGFAGRSVRGFFGGG